MILGFLILVQFFFTGLEAVQPISSIPICARIKNVGKENKIKTKIKNNEDHFHHQSIPLEGEKFTKTRKIWFLLRKLNDPKSM